VIRVPCKLCGKPVIWAETPDGGKVPLDPRPPVYRAIDALEGPVQAEHLKPSPSSLFRANEIAYFVSHFATCANVSQLYGEAASGEALTDCTRCGWPTLDSAESTEPRCALCAGNIRSACCAGAIRVAEPGVYECTACGLGVGRFWRLRTRNEDPALPVFAG